MEVSSIKRKGQHLHCCRDCVTRGPDHRQAEVTFGNFAEENLRYFLQTGADVQIGTYDRSSHAG